MAEHPTVAARRSSRNLDLAAIAGRSCLPAELRGSDGMTRLNWIIDQPDPGSFVTDLAIGELYYLMKDIGTGDSRILLDLASKEQIGGMLDLDVWTGHEVRLDRWLGWLDLAISCDDDTAIKLVQATESELLQLLFTRVAQVHPRDLDIDTVPDDLQVLATPDGAFWVTVPRDHDVCDRLHGLLTLLWAADLDRMRDIFQTARFELPTSVEEVLLYFRRGRLNEMGFSAPDEALSVYSWVPFKKVRDEIRAELSDLPSYQTRLQGVVVQDLVLTGINTPDLLAEALLGLTDESRARVAEALTGLVNKVFMADTGDLSEVDHLTAAGKRAAAYVSLGLAYVADESPRRATEVLERFRPEQLFQVGYSQLLHLSRRVRKLRSRAGAQLGLQLFGGALDEAFEGMARIRPLYFDGLDEAGAPGWREFTTSAELARMTVLVEDADRVLHFFEEHLGLSPERLVAADFDGMPDDDVRQVTLRTLFRTGLAQVVLTESFKFEPLTRDDLATFLGVAFDLQADVPTISTQLRGVLEDLGRHVEPEVHTWMQSALEELGLALGRVRAYDLEPDYARELVLTR